MKTCNGQTAKSCWTLVGLTIMLTASLRSQPPVASQVLTLQVQELNSVRPSRERLFLNTLAGTEPEGKAQASAALIWTSNTESRKLSVSCAEASPSAKLRISVIPPAGIERSFYESVELDDQTSRDFVRALAKSAGSCVLEFLFTGRVKVSEMRFVDVLYTITSS